MNFELLYLKQEYLLYLAGVMIVAGIMKDSNYLNDFYQIIASKIKSKRLGFKIEIEMCKWMDKLKCKLGAFRA